MIWTLLSAVDDARRPSARYSHGFTSVGGLLYVNGGYGLGFFNGEGDALSLSLSLLDSVPAHTARRLPLLYPESTVREGGS
jgi:hypothetical protein